MDESGIGMDGGGRVGTGTRSRPLRALVGLLLVLVAGVGAMLAAGIAGPKLAIDLAGGTSVTLAAKPAPGGGGVTPEALRQAVGIIRQRVNGSGVSEAQVATRGGDHILVTVPGQGNQDIVDLVGQTALLRFRPVLVNGPPQPSTGTDRPPAPDVAGVTDQVWQRYQRLDCTDPQQRQGGEQARPDDPLATCDRDGTSKYLLGPSAVEGADLASAHAVLPKATMRWQVNLTYNAKGTRQFADITRALVDQPPPRNQLAIVLDGVVVSAPRIQQAITGGRAQITGDFSQSEAKNLANVLRYGALPLAFEPSQVTSISPTVGADQLRAGLLAGASGLALVALYCLVYYRRLGGIAVASLAVAGALAYLAVSLLGVVSGYRLSLAGIAGIIVAVGITADSFVVFFERLRDELREGRTLRSAVERGWVRARRTIIVADVVSFLAAAVLYQFSIDQVKGFAFTLGLTTLIDVLVVFMFTKPLTTLVARTGRLAAADTRLGGLGGRLYRGEVSFEFVGHTRRWFALSAVILLLATAGLLGRGLQLGVEFEGGAAYQAAAGGASVASVRDAVTAQGVADPQVRQLGNGDILVETGRIGTGQAQQVRQAVAQTLDVAPAQVRTDIVGPSWGADVTHKALVSLAVFLSLIVGYLSVAFEPRMAVAAVAALLHDLLITVGVYALVGFAVTPATVIGVLTILGYSLYDTVVVFDKVKENTRTLRGRHTGAYRRAANLALNQTLVRSVNTSLIALLPVAAILFVGAGLLGAGTLQDLALALLVGIAAGTYSSLFVAVPLLTLLNRWWGPVRHPAGRTGRAGGLSTASPRPAAPVGVVHRRA